MTVSANKSPDGSTVTINISDRFDFSVHRDFRKAYEHPTDPKPSYVVDLHGAPYMDSSALGMLLQLREYAGNRRDSVKVKNAGPAIKDILRIANFDKLMIVE
jgi:HptB-dependent secretion and biofilm anti anti-sigma factor